MSTSVQSRHEQLKPLIDAVLGVDDPVDKLEVLDALPVVRDYLSKQSLVRTFLAGLNDDCAVAIKSVIAIGQADIVFHVPSDYEDPFDALRGLLNLLLEVESFYQPIGGIIGYHVMVLQLLAERELGHTATDDGANYLEPEGLDIAQDSHMVHNYVRRGIERLDEMAEIYPVGGAGDRLNLRCAQTGEALPAALLMFRGYTLLERLVRDLEGREYLYYKLTGKQLKTPVAMMTSQEKNNRHYITQLCEQRRWFGRPHDSFYMFEQPLVPVITVEGDWALSAPLSLTLKPGGHGVIWKLADDSGVFRWLNGHNRRKALVRQINNPVSGTDHGLLAFAGVGLQEDKVFGFASCLREVCASEGMNVLVENQKDGEYEYRLTNIEYTDFALRGIEDKPVKPDSHYSAFPANTNILFIDVEAVAGLAHQHPVPGMLVNMKSKTVTLSKRGRRHEVHAGRLETTMQNIADFIVDKRQEPLPPGRREALITYLTFNDRRKTISVTKNLEGKGGSIHETPQGCMYDILANMRQLLTEHCGMTLPPRPSEEEYVKLGPAIMVNFHPALGPLWSVIAQKIRSGQMAYGAEMLLEIAELDMVNLNLDGSLLVKADMPLGHMADDGMLHYSDVAGKCVLKDVTIRNCGIDRTATKNYWSGDIVRHEACTIEIHGSGEFVADGVVLEGNQTITVPDRMRVTATMVDGRLVFKSESIDEPKALWQYAFDDVDRVMLQRK